MQSNEVATLTQTSKHASYKSKIEAGKDDPKSIWNFFLKNLLHQTRKKDNTDFFKLNIDDNLITDTKEIADTVNDYFVNIASKLKEPVEDCSFTQLKEHIDRIQEYQLTFLLNYLISLKALFTNFYQTLIFLSLLD